MKKIYLILALMVVILLVLGVILFFAQSGKNTATNQNPGQTGFPLSQNTGSGTNSGTSSNTKIMTITSSSGITINVPDFLHNGTTIEDPANVGTYYLVGSSGACKPDGTCPRAGTTNDYSIVYYPSDGSFIIGLATEPLGSVRKEAEQYLMQTLGLTQDEMCALKYSVMTTTYVSQTYGGENLGFSFCPGAVALP